MYDFSWDWDFFIGLQMLKDLKNSKRTKKSEIERGDREPVETKLMLWFENVVENGQWGRKQVRKESSILRDKETAWIGVPFTERGFWIFLVWRFIQEKIVIFKRWIRISKEYWKTWKFLEREIDSRDINKIF